LKKFEAKVVGVVSRSFARWLAVATALLLAIYLPYSGVGPYFLHIAVLSLLNALLALGLNLIAGYAGQLSLAQAAFFGLGSYVAALLMLNFKISFWLAAPAGAIFAGGIAVLFGLPTLRLKGPYFVISTLGFGEIIQQILLNWESVTRGPSGLIGIPAPNPINLGFTILTFDTKTGAYYLALAVLAAVLIVYYNLVNSRVGRALRAIRNDQVAAEVMGINLAFYKVFAFGFAAVLSGLAGALYAGYMRFISPDTFSVGEAVNILIMMVLGGMGTIVGPIVGAIGITYLLETMRVFADYRMIVYGLLMFFIILYMPKGLTGAAAAIGERAAALWTARQGPLAARTGTERPSGAADGEA